MAKEKFSIIRRVVLAVIVLLSAGVAYYGGAEIDISMLIENIMTGDASEQVQVLEDMGGDEYHAPED